MSKIPMIPKISYFENGDMPEKLVTLSQRTTPDASTKNQYGSTRTDGSLEALSGPRLPAGVPSNLLGI